MSLPRFGKPRCIGKKRFDKKGAIGAIRFGKERRGILFRSYLCPDGHDHYHLTTKDKYGDKML